MCTSIFAAFFDTFHISLNVTQNVVIYLIRNINFLLRRLVLVILQRNLQKFIL